KDPRFALTKDRVRYRDEVVAIVQKAVGDKPPMDVLHRLETIGVPCAPINTLQDNLENQHTIARGLIQTMGNSGMGDMKAVVMPIMFNNESRDLGNPPPQLGENSEQILSQLGYSSDEIAHL